jgi:hypothetical protein
MMELLVALLVVLNVGLIVWAGRRELALRQVRAELATIIARLLASSKDLERRHVDLVALHEEFKAQLAVLGVAAHRAGATLAAAFGVDDGSARGA